MDRDAFHIPGPGPYLLTHSVGCLSRTAEIALVQKYLTPWRKEGGDAWSTWLDGIADFRDSLSQLLGGNAEQYCPQPNLSAALARLLGSLPKPKDARRVWLAAEDTFPSLGFVLQAAERLGFSLRLIPRQHNPTELHSWVNAITPEVCGVLITHVHSNTGALAPVADIAKLCRAADILSVVDVAQSVGIMPLQVEELGSDVLLGSCVKWLCGGPGAGFMWIRPSLISALQPRDVGWFSHLDPFEFDIRSFEFSPDARRFLGGTPCVAPFILAAEALKTAARNGVLATLAHNRNLMRIFNDGLAPQWRARLPAYPIGGTLCISTGEDSKAVAAALQTVKARYDWRDTTVRLSFHLYNNIDDAAKTAKAWPILCSEVAT